MSGGQGVILHRQVCIFFCCKEGRRRSRRFCKIKFVGLIFAAVYHYVDGWFI